MQVCGECGASNEAGEDFCGECGSYLEWDGEQATEPASSGQETAAEPVAEPVAGPVAEEPARGLAERMKAAVGIGGGDAPAARDLPSAPSSDQAPQEPTAEDGKSQPARANENGAESASEEVESPAPTGADPAAALVVRVPPPRADTGPTTPRKPAPVRPGAPAPKPRRRPGSKDREPINPGDLICGSCGAGNKPTRKFCRRCGTTLAEAEVARIPWWRRLFTRSGRPTGPEAGTRPRQRRRRRLPRRLLAFALIVALGGAGVWFARGMSFVEPTYEMVQDRIKGTEKVNPTRLTASSSARGRGARRARDGVSNRFWAPARPGEAQGEFLEATFEEPQRMVYLLLIPGVSQDDEEKYLKHGRPSEIQVTLSRSDGSTRVEHIELEDKIGEQQFNVATSDVTKVKLTIERSRAGSRKGTRVAIAEVEFRARKD